MTHCGAPSEPLWTPFSTLGLCDVTRPRRQACWPLAPARCSPASSLGLALGQRPCAPPGRGQSGVPRPDGLSPKPEVGLTQHHTVIAWQGPVLNFIETVHGPSPLKRGSTVADPEPSVGGCRAGRGPRALSSTHVAHRPPVCALGHTLPRCPARDGRSAPSARQSSRVQTRFTSSAIQELLFVLSGCFFFFGN